MTTSEIVNMSHWLTYPIDHRLGTEWVVRWHYTHHDSSACNYWGTYDDDNELVAVVSVGLTANQHGVAKKFHIDRWLGNLEIKRVVAHPDAPYNTASRAVAATCDVFAANGYEWLFSYADAGQGHHGGIYQSLNAVYVGMTPARTGWRIDGKMTHPRTIVSRWGTQAEGKLAEISARTGIKIEKVRNAISAKHCYILLIGPPATRRAMRRALAPYTQPYPKRPNWDQVRNAKPRWELAA